MSTSPQTPPTRPPAATDGRSRLRTLLLPCALLFVAMLNLTLVVAGLKELVVDELGGTVADTALFFTVEMLAYLVFAPLWGALSDRAGKRRLFIGAGFAASGIIYLVYLGIDSVPLLFTLRFFQGGASIAGWSTTMALLFDHAEESTATRARFAGFAGASLILGVGIGAPIGGVLTAHLGARAPLAVAGALFLLLALASLALVEARVVHVRPKFADVWRSLAARPRLLFPWSLYAMERFTVGLFVVVFPLWLMEQQGADPAARGRALALFLFPFALFQMGTYRLAKRFGVFPLLAIGCAGYGVAFSALGRVSPAWLYPLLVLLGAFAAVIFPPTLSLTAEWTAPEARASALAGFNVAGSLGFALGPIAGAWAHHAAGFRASFDLAAAVAMLGAVAALIAVFRARSGFAR